jgi:hypothetical protein
MSPAVCYLFVIIDVRMCSFVICRRFRVSAQLSYVCFIKCKPLHNQLMPGFVTQDETDAVLGKAN